MATQTEQIRCKAENCEQVIAIRWNNGSVKPIVTDAYVDEYTRLVITCPACGKRNRLRGGEKPQRMILEPKSDEVK